LRIGVVLVVRAGFWHGPRCADGACRSARSGRGDERGVPRPQHAAIGKRLRRSAWGKGYATDGSRAFAFTMLVNAASRRVLEKAGLKFVLIVHRDWPIHVDDDGHGPA
jgi:RimJ/RimL family protein N-acetyltransferase